MDDYGNISDNKSKSICMKNGNYTYYPDNKNLFGSPELQPWMTVDVL